MDFDLRADGADKGEREFHLTMEGGHSHRRIIHAADRTGRAISEVLTERAAAAEALEAVLTQLGKVVALDYAALAAREPGDVFRIVAVRGRTTTTRSQ